MPKEIPFKNHKRSGDVTGRGPKNTPLASLMHQGGNKYDHAVPTQLGAILKQDSSTHGESPLKLKTLMRQG